MSKKNIQQFLNQIKFYSEETKLTSIKEYLSNIPDRDLRSITETILLHSTVHQEETHYVVLIHGIRTHAEWQERLAERLNHVENVKAFPIGYGYFDVFKFWCPLWTRKAPVERILREIRTLKTQDPNARISIVAHSFGTYIVSKILANETDIKIHRLQLCGSIISPKYRWDQVISRITGNTVNDAGTKDIWPIMASALSWGYGASGVFGFKTVNVKDRYHDCGHSDFFSDNHMTKYWVPLIIDGQVVKSEWTSSRPSPGIIINFLNWFPFKTAILVGIIYNFVILKFL